MRLFRLATALAVVLCAPAFATVVMALTLEEMSAMAPVIVHGTVRRSVTGWDDAHRSIWTWTELEVHESLKGRPLRTALVKQPGGVVGGIGQSVSGAASFESGEEVVLFLEPAVDEPNAFVVLAMGAGKVTIESTLGPKVARRNLAGLSFARRGGAGVIGPVTEREHLGAADAFLKRIRAAVKGGAR